MQCSSSFAVASVWRSWARARVTPRARNIQRRGMRIEYAIGTAVGRSESVPAEAPPRSVARHQRVVEAIFAKRANIAWTDIEAMLLSYGAEMSRVRIALNSVHAVFHRPHPQKETVRGAVASMQKVLVEAGAGVERKPLSGATFCALFGVPQPAGKPLFPSASFHDSKASGHFSEMPALRPSVFPSGPPQRNYLGCAAGQNREESSRTARKEL